MDYDEVELLRERHPAWRLLWSANAALTLSFLGLFFVEQGRGATAASVLSEALDDELYLRNADTPDEPRFPRRPEHYLDDWAESGWLRRFYPLGSDEVHYDALPALERAYAWLTGLQVRAFVGTESRLQTVLELLRRSSTAPRPTQTSGWPSCSDAATRSTSRWPPSAPVRCRCSVRPACATAISSSPRRRGTCCRTSVRWGRTSARSTGRRANASPRGTAARVSCWPTWSAAGPTSPARTRAAAFRRSTTSCCPRTGRTSFHSAGPGRAAGRARHRPPAADGAL